jgi:hypothetical protein
VTGAAGADGRLPLDDPRWDTLGHRGGKGTENDAPHPAGELKELLTDPGDEDRFGDYWPYLCSEGTTWPAAYAATPYLVDMAAALPPDRRANKLAVVGLIIACGSDGSCPDDLRPAYLAAQQRMYPLIGASLPFLDGNDLRYVLAAIAALRGQVPLAEVLANIDTVSGTCPECGEEVWPEELQELV